jgi:hypothetical protein
MVKMKNHSEPEDSKISKLNEFFLVADRIWKARRSSRQGFGKFKSKPNPNGGGARLSVLISSGISPFANGPLSLATPSVQSSREAPLTQSVFPSENPLGKEEKKEIRAPEVPAAPNNPARCQALARAAQTSSERSNGGAHEGSLQRSPPEITLSNMPDQATSGADETASQPSPPQVSFSPSSFPLRLSESFSAYEGQGLE